MAYALEKHTTIQEYNAEHQNFEDMRDAPSLLRDVRLAHAMRRRRRKIQLDNISV